MIPTLPFPARPELLLCHPTPKPLHGQAPRVIYGDSWWQKKRQEVYAFSNYSCCACGVHKSQAAFKRQVEAHERYEIFYSEGYMVMKEIISACPFCHSYIHANRLEAMTQAGIYSKAFQDAVISHGEAILRRAGLPLRPEVPPEETHAPWKEWRILVEDGMPYYSKFIDERHWRAHYAAENAKQLRGKSS
jgi:hypothetical protein